jgi:hypothetical protein
VVSLHFFQILSLLRYIFIDTASFQIIADIFQAIGLTPWNSYSFEIMWITTYDIHLLFGISLSRMDLCHWTHSLKFIFLSIQHKYYHFAAISYRNYFNGEGIRLSLWHRTHSCILRFYGKKSFWLPYKITQILNLFYLKSAYSRLTCPVGLTPLR